MEHMSVCLQLMRWRQEDQDLTIILGYDRGFEASVGYTSACLKTKTNMLTRTRLLQFSNHGHYSLPFA